MPTNAECCTNVQSPGSRWRSYVVATTAASDRVVRTERLGRGALARAAATEPGNPIPGSSTTHIGEAMASFDEQYPYTEMRPSPYGANPLVEAS
jgi:hypothetical protein